MRPVALLLLLVLLSLAATVTLPPSDDGAGPAGLYDDADTDSAAVASLDPLLPVTAVAPRPADGATRLGPPFVSPLSASAGSLTRRVPRAPPSA